MTAPAPARELSPRVSIGPMRCADCGGGDCIIFVCTPSPTAFCSPLCAAAYGAEPWASANLLMRMQWHDPAPGGSPASPKE